MAAITSLLITLDGHAGAGKGTIGRYLAEHKGYQYIDSGLLYRAVTSRHLEHGQDPVLIAAELTAEDLKRPNLRSQQVDEVVASIGKIPAVRVEVNKSLRRLINSAAGTVMDGRAGAWEFPEAAVKIFLTASLDVRAWRRYYQLRKAGDLEITFEQVRSSMAARDQQDEARETQPLKPAPGAILVNTDGKNEDEVFVEVLEIVERTLVAA